MATLHSYELNGKKLSFANWISNLSPTETPFISMIPKQQIDQVTYHWQSDRLAKPGKEAATSAGEIDSGTADSDLAAVLEGSAVTATNKLFKTKEHKNYTQIFRKAVRVTDTTKKIALYGRGSELNYQMEKAGLELKRDLEFHLLNSYEAGEIGTSAKPSICAGIQQLVAGPNVADGDTGATVHQVVTYSKDPANDARVVRFTKKQVFDLTYNLYLVGSRANKIMFHPMHMAEFSDWIGNTKPGTVIPKPHLHRMFDGMDDKYNAYVKTIRDPLGQEFTLIPNRHMPKNQLFFFNESDWTQMVLRAPEKIELAKMGSSEKHMIEMEVGLRVRNPFCSGILEFNQETLAHIQDVKVTPMSALANDTLANAESATVTIKVEKADGTGDTKQVKVTGTSVGGENVEVTGSPATPNAQGVATVTVKSKKAGRSKLKVEFNTASEGAEPANGGAAEVVADFHVA